MPHPSHVDHLFSDWLRERRISSISPTFSIAIESPCSVCQPRIGNGLASYLNEFDDHSNGSDWLTINDHRFEQIQAHPDFRYLVGKKKADDTGASIGFLSNQGFVIFEMTTCHADTSHLENVFQVSMSCKEPEGSNHHLWLNAKRISQRNLIPMIANSFLDWATPPSS